jgi:hypothetical protein
MVEYADDCQPGCRFQAGAFTTEDEARKFFDRLSKTGSYGEISITMVPVHYTVRTGNGIADQLSCCRGSASWPAWPTAASADVGPRFSRVLPGCS